MKKYKNKISGLIGILKRLLFVLMFPFIGIALIILLGIVLILNLFSYVLKGELLFKINYGRK